jgi:NAD-dependent deacetylase
MTPERCAELIERSKKIVVMTGAGISTAAGIPDFRGPRGLYVTRQYDPNKVFEISAFEKEPEYFYQFTQDFVTVVKEIKPTFTHFFVTALEKMGKLQTVVTQNIDLLHQSSGTSRVIEVHGSYGSARCLSCGAKYDDLTYSWWDENLKKSATAPVVHCFKCQGLLKPDIVFFSEPVNDFTRAEEAVSRCDLLFVLGSSLAVAPASYLPQSTNSETIVVNQGRVALPKTAHRHFVDVDLDSYFKDVSKHLSGFDNAYAQALECAQ